MNLRYSLVLLAILTVLAILAGHNSAEESESAETKVLSKDWTVLHLGKKRDKGRKSLPEDSPVVVLDDFEVDGPKPFDRNRIGEFKSGGNWGLVDGWLQRTEGKETALHLGRADDFEMEGMIDAEGLGGWFLIVGWDKKHGYLLYNVTLKASGSPWILAELRNGKGIDNTHREITRHAWKGSQPLRLKVIEDKLTMSIGEQTVIRDLYLTNYAEGDIILGTYDTQYGPKPVRIRSLRIRSK